MIEALREVTKNLIKTGGFDFDLQKLDEMELKELIEVNKLFTEQGELILKLRETNTKGAVNEANAKGYGKDENAAHAEHQYAAYQQTPNVFSGDNERAIERANWPEDNERALVRANCLSVDSEHVLERAELTTACWRELKPHLRRIGNDIYGKMGVRWVPLRKDGLGYVLSWARRLYPEFRNETRILKELQANIERMVSEEDLDELKPNGVLTKNGWFLPYGGVPHKLSEREKVTGIVPGTVFDKSAGGSECLAAAIVRLNANWDEGVSTDDGMAFLLRVCPVEGLAAALWLMAESWISVGKKFFLLFDEEGTGDNGKSSFLNTWRMVVEECSMGVSMKTAKDGNLLVAMDKVLLVMEEIDLYGIKRKKGNENPFISFLKQVSGMTSISADMKYENQKEVRVLKTFVGTLNGEPEIGDESLFNRLVPICFNNKVNGINDELYKRSRSGEETLLSSLLKVAVYAQTYFFAKMDRVEWTGPRVIVGPGVWKAAKNVREPAEFAVRRDEGIFDLVWELGFVGDELNAAKNRKAIEMREANGFTLPWGERQLMVDSVREKIEVGKINNAIDGILEFYGAKGSPGLREKGIDYCELRKLIKEIEQEACNVKWLPTSKTRKRLKINGYEICCRVADFSLA